ncbi:MAG: DedA family protein [Chlorobiaceae bacterium]|jgi:membrane protein DedA with SNARE-associated domain|nr:DedA family protein [Chlorobiaceae bacterium]
MLESLIDYLQHADPFSVYVFLFIVAFFENVIPPIPGDIAVAFIGYMIHSSKLSFTAAVLWTSLGSTSGFMLVYLLSRHLGLKLYAVGENAVQHRLSQSVHRFFPPSDMEVLRQKFSTHGYLAVLFNRFLLGSRAVISVMTGLMHLNTFLVLLASLVSATLWNILLIYGGLLLGRNWQEIGRYAALYSFPVTALFLIFLFFSARKFIRERKQKHH